MARFCPVLGAVLPHFGLLSLFCAVKCAMCPFLAWFVHFLARFYPVLGAVLPHFGSVLLFCAVSCAMCPFLAWFVRFLTQFCPVLGAVLPHLDSLSLFVRFRVRFGFWCGLAHFKARSPPAYKMP